MTKQAGLDTSAIIQLLEKEGLEVSVHGRKDVIIDHLCSLEQADRNSLCFYIGYDNEKLSHLENCILICNSGVLSRNLTVTHIATKDPKLAFYIIAQDFTPPKPSPKIHPSCVIHPEAIIHPTVSVGPFCVLDKCLIRENAILHSNVRVYENTVIGASTVIEANTCIGATGQVWAWDKNGKRWELPQIGGTVIGDNCFIGSNVTIVRGALGDTAIGNECRIAHGSMLGHNCKIGDYTFISNGVAISGSVAIGSHCFLGSGSRYRPGISLGHSIYVGVGAVVINDFHEKNSVLAGVPSKVIKILRDNVQLAGIPKLSGNESDNE